MAGSRSLAGQIPRIPHLARSRSEVGDLRDDVDVAFSVLESEVDVLDTRVTNIPLGYLNVSDVLTDVSIDAAAGDHIRCDPSTNAQQVNLPPVSALNKGVPVEVKAAVGTSPGSPLTNNITVVPSVGETIDGAANFVISKQRASVVFRSDGATGWVVSSAYLPFGPTGPSVDDLQTDSFTASAGQKFFALTQAPIDPNDVKMSVNGQEQVNGTDFVVVGVSVNFLEVDFVLEAGDQVEFSYHF